MTICKVCKAHKENYLEAMKRPCHEEHGVNGTESQNERHEETDRSDCPICGGSYPHREDYIPKTCGTVNCLREARKRGWL